MLVLVMGRAAPRMSAHAMLTGRTVRIAQRAETVDRAAAHLSLHGRTHRQLRGPIIDTRSAQTRVSAIARQGTAYALKATREKPVSARPAPMIALDMESARL